MTYENNEHFYEGQVKKGTLTKQGKGTMVYKDGSTYDGWWLDNLYHG